MSGNLFNGYITVAIYGKQDTKHRIKQQIAVIEGEIFLKKNTIIPVLL